MAIEDHSVPPAELQGAPWKRFAVLGDSIAEGLGEVVPGYGPGGWADRVADALRRGQPALEYLNLGRRDLRAAEVRASQLDPALAFEPDLAAVICGGNDLLSPAFDADAVEDEIDAIVAGLVGAEAEVITFTMFDITKAIDMPPEFGDALGVRLDALAERTRAVARRHRTIHVELHGHPAAADRSIYSSDLRHANTRGHAICAAATVRRLGARLGR